MFYPISISCLSTVVISLRKISSTWLCNSILTFQYIYMKTLVYLHGPFRNRLLSGQSYWTFFPLYILFNPGQCLAPLNPLYLAKICLPWLLWPSPLLVPKSQPADHEEKQQVEKSTCSVDLPKLRLSLQISHWESAVPLQIYFSDTSICFGQDLYLQYLTQSVA